MALLSFAGFDTPSLSAQGEQRLPHIFNNRRDIPVHASILGQFDYALQRWAKRKFKRLKASPTKARAWLRRVAKQKPNLFAHWSITFAGLAER
jgi:hypothetical protein